MSEGEPFDPILISMGDPAGIGPEIIDKGLKSSEIYRKRDVIIIGDVVAFARALGSNTAMHQFHIAPYDDFLYDPVGIVEAFEYGSGVRSKAYFVDIGDENESIMPGEGSPESGMLALASFNATLELIERGCGSTLVTAPFAKKWVQEAGFEFPGHTEALGSFTGDEPVMILVGGGLKASFVTVHEPIVSLSEKITEERVRSTTIATHNSMKLDFSIGSPRLAVCGLNPHAGEGGNIGREELETIAPAVASLKDDGVNVAGPFSGDTVFHRAREGEFDAVVAMYHDQGAIPVKLAAFDSGVNFTANLPIVRTSPDHGTAYDIAGRDKADPTSFISALELADAISMRRQGVVTEATRAERRKT